MLAPRSSTLFATERLLRPVTLCVVVGFGALGVGSLFALQRSVSLPLWLGTCVLCTATLASNLHYLYAHNGRTTFGMIPIALFGLLPAALLAGLSPVPAVRMTGDIALLLLGAMTTMLAFWFWRLWRTYHPACEVSEAAALIVLGGAIKKGRPCHTLCLRLDVAARLWHESKLRTIVVSGGPTPDGSTTEADAMASYLVESGVDPEHIVIERRASNTRENILFSCALLDERGFAGQRCVVSSDYHLYRALRDARRLGQELCPVAAPTPTGSMPQQWCREVLTLLFGK